MADLYVAEDKKRPKPASLPSQRPLEEKKKKEKSLSQEHPRLEAGLRQLEREQTKNPLASFIAVPKNVRFETQDVQEKVLLLLRRHWITNIRWILLAAALITLPTLLKYFPIFSFMPARFQLFSVTLWYLFVIAFILEGFLTWFFNVYIITDERIVDIDFYNLLYKQITEAKIDKVQDITMRMGGAIRTLFNYGDVLIQTAGAEPNLEFEAVPKPDHVVRVLQELRTQEEIEALEGRVR